MSLRTTSTTFSAPQSRLPITFGMPSLQGLRSLPASSEQRLTECFAASVTLSNNFKVAPRLHQHLNRRDLAFWSALLRRSLRLRRAARRLGLNLAQPPSV